MTYGEHHLAARRKRSVSESVCWRMETPASTSVRAIRYDALRRRLLVRFEDGDEYAFVGVPGEAHRSFAAAPSKDRFFLDEIRGRYPYNKMT